MTVDDSQETVDVSEESEPEPEPKPVKKKTTSKRLVKKKVTIYADDNIIPDPDVALELGKSISLTEAEEEEAAKQVHATHARIVTESDLESAKKTGSISSRSVVIQDTPSDPKPKLVTSKTKLKGVQSLTPAEKEIAYIMQALKESKKTSKRQPGIGGSSEGTDTIPGVLDDSTVVSTTSSEGTEEDQLDDGEKEDKEGDADDEGDDHISDTQDTDDEDDETKSNEDEIYKYKIHVRKDEDEEMLNAEVEDSGKSSNLTVSSGFGDQFLKLSSDTSLIGIVKDTTHAEISSLLDIKIQSEVPHIQSPSVLKVHVFVISKPSVLTPVQETSSTAPVTTLPFPSVSTTPPLRVAKLEKDVSELKKIDDSAKALATLKSQVPTVVEQYIGSKISDDLQMSRTINESMMMMMMKILQLDQTRVRRQRGEEPRSQSLQRSFPPPRKPQKVKLHQKALKTSKSASAKEPVKEPIAEVVIDDADKLDWNNLEGDRYPFDLSKTFPPQGHPGHLTVAADYFFNNDLEYLKSSDPERTYTTSIMKTKAARYEIMGIEDMVPTLMSPTKVRYDKDALKGIKHWGKRRKLWHRSQMNKISKHNVYSTQKILGVKSVSVKKLHGYGHLEEVVVKRADRQLCKFKEGDFVDLHLNDIEYMLLLDIQRKLFHINESIVDFIVSLRMFTRSLTFPEIEFKELYTPSHKPPGVIYEDLAKQKRVMRVDKLYKFLDGTLKKVRDEIQHRVLDFCLGYNDEMARRKWMAIDRKRSHLIVELIDKHMRERRITRNLQRLVGAQELEMDYKLMTRTV
nr:hypothetical protein [Tanacetum cinerariifolium]